LYQLFRFFLRGGFLSEVFMEFDDLVKLVLFVCNVVGEVEVERYVDFHYCFECLGQELAVVIF
jgi:hypothetical protein